jgi:hypothetical protein
MQVQKVAEVFRQVPDCGDCELDAKVCGVGICDWYLQNDFSAAVELAQECFAIEQPRIGQLVCGRLDGFQCGVGGRRVERVTLFTLYTNFLLAILYDIYCLML